MTNVTEVIPASEWAGRVKRSKSEALHETFAGQLRARRIPEPVRELRFAKELGRQWRFDFAWPDFKLAFEIEGLVIRPMYDAPHPKAQQIMAAMGGHASPEGLQKDIEKYNTAALLGWTVIRGEQKGVKSGESCSMLLRVLASRGWVVPL